MRAALLVVLVAAAAALVPRAAGFAINVDAHSEECFLEAVEAGTHLGLSFQVAEGGFLDVDVVVKDPEGKVIYEEERVSDGKFTFNAHTSGVFTYCFSNRMSTVTPKLVVFNMVIGQKHAEQAEGDVAHEKLHDMTQELSDALFNIKREQEYMEIREKTHRLINDNTNARVVWWSFFEALVLVAMTVGQVFYLSRFFEVRTTV